MKARNILLFLLAFLGVGALYGGSVLILDPSGELIGGMPVTLLYGSPFSNFLIPGIILFVVLGILPCVVVYALINKPECKFAEHLNFFHDMHWAWSFTIYIAFALIIWIQVETIVLKGTSLLQTIYMLYAIPILLVALLPKVRSLYTKKST